MKHVIIGNGPAGVIAAETLRRLDPDSDIVLIGDEKEPPYSRMAIPYFLTRSIRESGTYLRKGRDHYRKLGIELMRAHVEKIDTSKDRVRLSNRKQIEYDRLLIATGSHPIRLNIPGISLPNVHPCWTLEDARRIAAKAKRGTRVVQIGAGFIGCIIMQALVERGVKLTVVEMGDRPVPRMMTERAGELIRQWVEERGVLMEVNAQVNGIARSGKAMRIRLSSGETFPCDLVIAAAGVQPNIDFLKGSGIKCGHGVLVDDRMQTSVPNIYAAGDVAEAADFHTGKPLVNAIQPNAADQARIAAANMAGRDARMLGTLAINVLDTLGLISTSFGQWEGVQDGDGVELADAKHFRYLSLQFKDDVLIGATSIGWTDHVGALRGLIQTCAKLGPWKDRLKRDPTQFMAAYLASAQKAA